MNELQSIGTGVLAFGAIFFILGCVFLMDRTMLVMSNVLILLGINLIMSPRDFITFILSKERIKGSIAFILGILLVLFKIPLPGIICEVTGAYWLFGGFLPLLLSLLSKLPFVPTKLFARNKSDLPL